VVKTKRQVHADGAWRTANTPVNAYDAQQSRVHHIEFATATIADLVERAVGEELTPVMFRIEKLKEEHKLTIVLHLSLSPTRHKINLGV
jgi:hypothetical protein